MAGTYLAPYARGVRLLTLVWLGCVIGCGKDGGAPASPPRPPPAPPASADAAPVDPCAALIDEYTRAIDGADLSCRTDADCGCYGGGIGDRSGCGGVAARVSVERLGEIADRYFAAGCRHTLQCGPWACEPTCVEARCQK
jgi:hypothetical protein